MKNTLLITASVAALLAGIGLASAQGLNERKDAPATTTSDPQAPAGQTGQQKSALPQKNEKMKSGTTAQTPDKANSSAAAQTPETAKPIPGAQGAQKQGAQNKNGSDHQTVGQAPGQDAAPNAATQKGGKSFASAPASAEQNTKIRDSLKGEKAERLDNVTFSISIGQEVPRSVHFYRLPARIVEYAPQYRGFDYIMVGEDILIVNPRTHRIVAVISA